MNGVIRGGTYSNSVDRYRSGRRNGSNSHTTADIWLGFRLEWCSA